MPLPAGPAITKQEVAEDRMQYKLRFFSVRTAAVPRLAAIRRSC